MNDNKNTAAQPLDLDKLEALAREAMPGPWEVQIDERPHYRGGVHHERRIATAWEHGQLKGKYPVVTTSVGIGKEADGPPHYMVGMREEDANFIAAANPETILNLIAQARASQPEGATLASQEETTGASIDTPEFRKLLCAQQNAEQACSDNGSDTNRDAANEAWDALIGHIDAIIADLRAQLAAKDRGEPLTVEVAYGIKDAAGPGTRVIPANSVMRHADGHYTVFIDAPASAQPADVDAERYRKVRAALSKADFDYYQAENASEDEIDAQVDEMPGAQPDRGAARDSFEAWAMGEDFWPTERFLRGGDGEYMDDEVHAHFVTWRAATAAAAAAAAAAASPASQPVAPEATHAALIRQLRNMASGSTGASAQLMREAADALSAHAQQEAAPAGPPDNEALETLWEDHVGHPADFGAAVLERWGGWQAGLLGYGGALNRKLVALTTVPDHSEREAANAGVRNNAPGSPHNICRQIESDLRAYIAKLEAQLAANAGGLDANGLLPCPHCGGKADYSCREEGYRAYLSVLCSACGAESCEVRYRSYDNGLDEDNRGYLPPAERKSDAAKLWNRRVQPTTIAAGQEAANAKDAARLDWLIQEEACVQCERLPGSGRKVFQVVWPENEDYSMTFYETPREAIDAQMSIDADNAAMAAVGAAGQEGGNHG
jgi:hypothetical protein